MMLFELLRTSFCVDILSRLLGMYPGLRSLSRASGNSAFTLFRDCQTAFQSSHTILFPAVMCEDSDFSTFLSTLHIVS